MNPSNINAIIDRIISKKIYFSYKDKIYYYKFPDIDIKLESNLIYEETFEQLKFEDIILEEDVDNTLQEYEIVDYSLKKHLERLNKKLDDLKVELFSSFYIDSKKKKIKNSIKNLRKNIQEAENQSRYLDRLTIESICANIQNEFLLLNGIYTKDHSLVFNSDVLGNVDQNLFNNLGQEIAKKFLKGYEYRIVARSLSWKSLWGIKNHHIFEGSVSEWSDEQKTIVSISQMYDSIYQHPECPEDDIIQDDDAIDGWSIYHSRKIKEEKKKNGVSSKLDRHKNAQEIFVVAETDEDIKSIIGMNDHTGFNRMKSKVDHAMVAAATQGTVREIDIPIVQSDLRQKSMEQRRK
jgi:hypothetical protein